MKLSLALGPRRELSRQTAWGCFTSNVAVPGIGSLAAGRRSGYAQVILGMIGLALTVLFGARAMYWFLTNWSRLHDPAGDPAALLSEMWQHLRIPLLGIAFFAFDWLWALATSLEILRQARTSETARKPPRL
jgi:hypothetical protein